MCGCHAAFATSSCVCQVEDIVDTGRTLKSLITSLQQQGVASVKIVTLLNKQARRMVDIQADYVGIQVNRWPGCIVFISLSAEKTQCIVCLHVGVLCNLYTTPLPQHDAVTDHSIPVQKQHLERLASDQKTCLFAVSKRICGGIWVGLRAQIPLFAVHRHPTP